MKLKKKVIRSIKKRVIYSCPKCSLVVKAPMPKLPIVGSLATSSTLAQVIVDKYASNQLPNVMHYLDFVLDKLANITINQGTDIDSLLPWNYSKN